MTKVSQERVSVFSQLDGNVLSGSGGFTDTGTHSIYCTPPGQRVHIRYLNMVVTCSFTTAHYFLFQWDFIDKYKVCVHQNNL